MRRAVCYSEPHQALAGEVGTWQLHYIPETNLPKNTKLRLDIDTFGREDIDWEIPSTDKKKDNAIFATLENGKTLTAKRICSEDQYAPDFEFTLPCKVEEGSRIIFTIGSAKPKKGKKPRGNRAQTYTQRKRPFYLYVDKGGKGRFDEPEIFTLDVKGNTLDFIQIITPSLVTKNKRFDISVRFRDVYGNLTASASDDTLIEISHDGMRESLKWKIFVPDTGHIILPNLYFTEEGFYKVYLKNLKTNEVFQSDPIYCQSEQKNSIFWGLLHGESEKVDSSENIESCLRHFRDEIGLNFYATSSFESLDETPNEIWKSIAQNIAEFNEEGRFVTFLGFQWQGVDKKEGLRHFVYLKDQRPLLRKNDTKSNTLKKIYKSHTNKDFLSIPAFTMGKGSAYHFENVDLEFERVVEIHNAWGCSEKIKRSGNPFPISGPKKGGVGEDPGGAILSALIDNKRFGFIAGGLDDRGTYADLFDNDQEQYAPGLTAIYAKTLSRTHLAEALYQRHCYATTGPKILVMFYVAGSPMGSELDTQKKPGLHYNRHINGYVAGTEKIKTIEIIRNGKVIKKLHPKTDRIAFEFDDMEMLEKSVIKSKPAPFAFYILSVIQEDGHRAWSSPIWIDLLPPLKKGTKS